jgi:hypothetical protein
MGQGCFLACLLLHSLEELFGNAFALFVWRDTEQQQLPACKFNSPAAQSILREGIIIIRKLRILFSAV